MSEGGGGASPEFAELAHFEIDGRSVRLLEKAPAGVTSLEEILRTVPYRILSGH